MNASKMLNDNRKLQSEKRMRKVLKTDRKREMPSRFVLEDGDICKHQYEDIN